MEAFTVDIRGVVVSQRATTGTRILCQHGTRCSATATSRCPPNAEITRQLFYEIFFNSKPTSTSVVRKTASNLIFRSRTPHWQFHSANRDKEKGVTSRRTDKQTHIDSIVIVAVVVIVVVNNLGYKVIGALPWPCQLSINVSGDRSVQPHPDHPVSKIEKEKMNLKKKSCPVFAAIFSKLKIVVFL